MISSSPGWPQGLKLFHNNNNNNNISLCFWGDGSVGKFLLCKHEDLTTGSQRHGKAGHRGVCLESDTGGVVMRLGNLGLTGPD